MVSWGTLNKSLRIFSLNELAVLGIRCECRAVIRFDANLFCGTCCQLRLLATPICFCLPCWGGQEFLKKVTKPCYSVYSQVSLPSFDKALSGAAAYPFFPFILTPDCPFPTSSHQLPLTSFTLSSDPATPLGKWRSAVGWLPLGFFLSSSSFCSFTCSFFPHFPSHLQRIYWEPFMCQAQCGL